MASTTETKNVNWTNLEDIAAVCNGNYPRVSKGGKLPDVVFDVHADNIRIAAQHFQNVILKAAKTSEKVNLSFITAAMLSVQTAKDQAIASLITPWNPARDVVVPRSSMSD